MNLTPYTGPEQITLQNIHPINQTKELINNYCSAIDNRLIILLVIVGIMWLIQPKVFKAIERINFKNKFIKELFGENSLKIIYKWLGIGLLFMAVYLIMIMS